MNRGHVSFSLGLSTARWEKEDRNIVLLQPQKQHDNINILSVQQTEVKGEKVTDVQLLGGFGQLLNCISFCFIKSV